MSNAESVQNIHEFLIRTIDRLIKTKSEYLVHKLGRDFAEIPKIRQVNQVMIHLTIHGQILQYQQYLTEI